MGTKKFYHYTFTQVHKRYYENLRNYIMEPTEDDLDLQTVCNETRTKF